MRKFLQVEWLHGADDIDRFCAHNLRQQTSEDSYGRLISLVTPSTHIKRVKKSANYPQGSIQNIRIFDHQKLLEKEEKRNIFTPAPPHQANYEERQYISLFKNFSQKYEFIWILITDGQHNSRKEFEKIYNDSSLRDKKDNLMNMIYPEQIRNIVSLIKQGLQVKLIFDYESYQRTYAKKRAQLQKNQKILEVYVETSSDHYAQRLIPSQKIKPTISILGLLNSKVRKQVQKSKKDIPYYNFVHFDSSPELFTRRSIIQECFIAKSKQECSQNIKMFSLKLEEETKIEEKKQIMGIINKSQILRERQRRKIEQKYFNFKKIHQQFQNMFLHFIADYFPIKQQQQEIQAKVYNWVIMMYCQQSLIYRKTNNTVRFSLNKEKVTYVSTMIKYLYDAIRFHFVRRFREIKYNKVYRGGRASLHEQNNFKQGQYLWNLGFMSTTRNDKQANQFIKKNLGNSSTDEGIFMVIQIPPLALGIEYIENHEGFWALDKIIEIKDRVLSHEEEVLFNPLNIFEIKKWDYEKKQLFLVYAPHLYLIQKKKSGQNLTEKELRLIKNLTKINDRQYDKGMKFLMEGNPSSAIKYYEQNELNGEILSFSQKSAYFESLKISGDIQKIQMIVKHEIQKQENQMEQNDSASYKSIQSRQTLETDLSTLELYQITDQFSKAHSKAQILLSMVKQDEEKGLDPELYLSEAKTLVEVAKVKFNVSMTLESIRIVNEGMHILSKMSNINCCSRLFKIAKKISLLTLQKIDDFPILQKIRENKQVLESNPEEESKNLKRELKKVKQEGVFGVDSKIFNESIISENYKKSHQKIEQLISQKLSQRDKRTKNQQFQQLMAESYWEISQAQISDFLSDKEKLEQKEILKQCRNQIIHFKKFYEEQLAIQERAYRVLYENVYKTSLNVEPILKSFIIFYSRYQDYMRIRTKNEQNSVELAKILQKCGQIKFEYGQIFERNEKNAHGETESEKKGIKLIKQAENILKKIEKEIKKQKIIFTHEKVELKNSIINFYKSEFLSSDEHRKTAMNKSANRLTNQVSSENKSNRFRELIKIIKEKKHLHNSDKNINNTYFRIEDASEEIQIINNSGGVIDREETYHERLIRCMPQFQSIKEIIEDQKKQQIFNKSVKMAYLYLIMGQNQFKLGLIKKSYEFIEKSKNCLKKVFKNSDEEIENCSPQQRILLRKIVYGNKTKVGLLKLQGHLIAFFGVDSKKKSFLQNLMKVKIFYEKYMDDPLSEAEISETVGLLYANHSTIISEMPSLVKFKKSMQESLQIRQNLLGLYRKQNARICSILADILSSSKSFKKDSKLYYEKGHQIYLHFDFSQDPNLIIFKAMHEYKNFIRENKIKQAYWELNQSFTMFHEFQNKLINMEVVNELYIGGNSMIKSRFIQDGIKWLRVSLSYLDFLKNYVEPQEAEELNKENFLVLEKIEEIQKRLDKVLDKYPQYS